MKTLVVITGPTATGKTELAIETAVRLGTSIISADSRQIYRHIPIGTAVPSIEERAAAPHYFIEELELDEYFSASLFEERALKLVEQLFTANDYVVMCGGSMMYIDAVVSGLDELPTISASVRERVQAEYRERGLTFLLEELRRRDPDYFETVDRNNVKRVIHALEIIEESGRKYSALRSNISKHRPFGITEFAIDVPRDVLYGRINDRVDRMIADGWIDEARAVQGYRNCNSLNTVGYKELFLMLDGCYDRATAIEKIKRNTRVYAKKQLTWLKKRPATHRLDYSWGTSGMARRILEILDVKS